MSQDAWHDDDPEYVGRCGGYLAASVMPSRFTGIVRVLSSPVPVTQSVSINEIIFVQVSIMLRNSRVHKEVAMRQFEAF